jgi:N-acyl-D-aspartate/D-glutamate deacylase
VMFDADAIGTGPTYLKKDMPGDEVRLYADAKGVDQVIVNGKQIVVGGKHTGALPGQVLRSGRDTETRRSVAH